MKLRVRGRERRDAPTAMADDGEGDLGSGPDVAAAPAPAPDGTAQPERDRGVARPPVRAARDRRGPRPRRRRAPPGRRRRPERPVPRPVHLRRPGRRAARPGPGPWVPDEVADARTCGARRAIEAEADAAEQAGVDLRLRRLARSFELDPYDVELLLLIALAPDLDPRFERLYGYLHDDVSRRRERRAWRSSCAPGRARRRPGDEQRLGAARAARRRRAGPRRGRRPARS